MRQPQSPRGLEGEALHDLGAVIGEGGEAGLVLHRGSVGGGHGASAQRKGGGGGRDELSREKAAPLGLAF
jgi:hypothetical protein